MPNSDDHRRNHMPLNPVSLASASDQPSVVIIVLNWNGWKDTLACISSLRKIAYRNYRILIFDNGSSDESVAQIMDWFRGNLDKKDYESIFPSNPVVGVSSSSLSDASNIYWCGNLAECNCILLSNDANLGYAGGNNCAIKFSLEFLHSDFILLLNNDTIVDADFLSHLVQAARADDRIGVCGPMVFWYDEPKEIQPSGGRISIWLGRRIPIDNENLRALNSLQVDVDYLSGVCLLLRVSLLDADSIFDPDFFVYTEDVDFCYRMRMAGRRIVLVTMSRIWHKTSKSSGGHASALSSYYIYRNSILFMRKYSRWYHLPTFILVSVLFASWRLMSAYIKNPSKARAMAAGLIDGLLNRTGQRAL